MLFGDIVECQEAIAMALVRSVDEAWDEIRLEAEFDEDSVETLVIYRRRGGAEFSGSVVGVDELSRYLFELQELVSTPEKGLPTKCIFTVHVDGRYKADFTY